MDPLVSTDWLAEQLAADDQGRDLRIADATLLAADLGRDARADFESAHIPGSVFLDLAELRDTASPLPNMLPPAAKVASRLARLGLGDGTRIVLYDNSPWRTAARAWWLLAGYGFTCAILDGGLAKWRAEGRALDDDPASPRPRHATPRLDTARWRSLAEVRAEVAPIVDARSASRFTGAEADPHPGTAPGHIPGSANLPYPRLFEPDGTWKRGEALAAAFNEAGVDPTMPFVATCGSGVTACVLAFGAHLLGTRASVYDGSWSEWGADPSTPKATGEAA